MTWYVKVSHPQIIPLDERSPPMSANREHLIVEEHAKEMPDTLTIIGDVVQIVDNVVAMSIEMTKDEVVQEMIRIGSTVRPTLMYQIARQRRGHRHRRQHS